MGHTACWNSDNDDNTTLAAPRKIHGDYLGARISALPGQSRFPWSTTEQGIDATRLCRA